MSEEAERALRILAGEGAKLARANARLNAPLSPDEMRLVDKHCDWIAFQHAWNAVMKKRREEITGEQQPTYHIDELVAGITPENMPSSDEQSKD